MSAAGVDVGITSASVGIRVWVGTDGMLVGGSGVSVANGVGVNSVMGVAPSGVVVGAIAVLNSFGVGVGASVDIKVGKAVGVGSAS